MKARRNKENMLYTGFPRDMKLSMGSPILRKILVSATTIVLLAVLYGVIFRFSAQDAEESGSLSQFVSEKCVEIMNVLTGSRWSESERIGLAEYFEHPIRKLAHFSEYAYMGVLVYVLWSQWLERGRKLNLLTVVWVFFSAAGDEFHQYFVPGRYASFADVLLDTCGGFFGMLFCICALRLYRRRGVRKRKKEGHASEEESAASDGESDIGLAENHTEAEILRGEVCERKAEMSDLEVE